MDDDFEYLHNMLRELWKLGDAFPEKDEFLGRLKAYKDAGRSFVRGTKAFLLWAEFGVETTVN